MSTKIDDQVNFIALPLWGKKEKVLENLFLVAKWIIYDFWVQSCDFKLKFIDELLFQTYIYPFIF